MVLGSGCVSPLSLEFRHAFRPAAATFLFACSHPPGASTHFSRSRCRSAPRASHAPLPLTCRLWKTQVVFCEAWLPSWATDATVSSVHRRERRHEGEISVLQDVESRRGSRPGRLSSRNSVGNRLTACPPVACYRQNRGGTAPNTRGRTPLALRLCEARRLIGYGR